MPAGDTRQVCAELDLWVQPRASRDEIAGWRGTALKVRVCAPPVEGEANGAVVRLLSRRLGIAPSAISIARGRGGRRKTIRVNGLTTDEVHRRLGV